VRVGSLPDIYLPVTEYAFRSFSVKRVHSCFCSLFSQPAKEQCPFFRAEELRSLGPIDYEELTQRCNDSGEKPFDDEDPPPAIISPNSCHVCKRISEQLPQFSYAVKDKGKGFTYSAPRSSKNDTAEEDIESPLQLVPLVIHRNQIQATCKG